MSSVTQENRLAREERIQDLESFAVSLAGVVGQCGHRADRIRSALGVALAGECVRCGIRVSGDELLALAESAPGKEPGPKIKRLRLGYCARDGCESYHYRLLFDSHPDLDWNAIIAQAQGVEEEKAKADAAAALAARASSHRRAAVRAGILLVVVVLLLVVRQLYFGGRIPLIREPEQFRVDPAAAGAEHVR